MSNKEINCPACIAVEDNHKSQQVKSPVNEDFYRRFEIGLPGLKKSLDEYCQAEVDAQKVFVNNQPKSGDSLSTHLDIDWRITSSYKDRELPIIARNPYPLPFPFAQDTIIRLPMLENLPQFEDDPAFSILKKTYHQIEEFDKDWIYTGETNHPETIKAWHHINEITDKMARRSLKEEGYVDVINGTDPILIEVRELMNQK